MTGAIAFIGWVAGGAGAAPDVTAPTLSAPQDGTPTADGSELFGVTTDEGNGTLYWAILTDGGTATDAQLKAGAGGNIVAGKAGNQEVVGTGAQTVTSVTGLSAATAYEIIFLHRDFAGNDSAQATVALTTAAGGAETEPYLSFSTALNSQYFAFGLI